MSNKGVGICEICKKETIVYLVNGKWICTCTIIKGWKSI